VRPRAPGRRSEEGGRAASWRPPRDTRGGGGEAAGGKKTIVCQAWRTSGLPSLRRVTRGGEMGSRLQDLERWRAGLVDDDGFRDPKLPHGECRALIPPTSNLWYVKGS
jgi:hypothetical protein